MARKKRRKKFCKVNCLPTWFSPSHHLLLRSHVYLVLWSSWVSTIKKKKSSLQCLILLSPSTIWVSLGYEELNPQVQSPHLNCLFMAQCGTYPGQCQAKKEQEMPNSEWLGTWGYRLGMGLGSLWTWGIFIGAIGLFISWRWGISS